MSEPSTAGAARPLVGSPDWRSRAHAEQEAVLPDGEVLVTCSAPLGVGGLGRHLQEILDALARRGNAGSFIGEGGGEGEAPGRSGRSAVGLLSDTLGPLARRSPSLRQWRVSVGFDADAARRLPALEHLIGFNGTSLAQFRAAARAGARSLSLVSATTHMRRVARQQAIAYRQYPIERPWAARMVARNVKEYELAGRIYVSSRYAWDTFLAEGVSEDLLAMFPLTPDPRFSARGPSRGASTFDIVFVGGLTVDKGVPLLLDAVSRLDHSDLRLVLVGGWKTRGMRRLIEAALARDGRIAVGPGDPLEHLQRASLCVHPAYSDGFAYSPAEAMACGVPVIVSEDTGMKELVRSGETGLVLPTGDLAALAEAIDAAYRGELLS